MIAGYRSADQGGPAGDLKLEVVILPVADVDRTKQFYAGLGWREDADVVGGEDFRIMQVTPPGSACSISFGIGVTPVARKREAGPPAPRSWAAGQASRSLRQRRQPALVTDDIERARAELVERGAPLSEVFHGPAGRFHPEEPSVRQMGRDPGVRATRHGNGWVLQEITQRLPGR